MRHFPPLCCALALAATMTAWAQSTSVETVRVSTDGTFVRPHVMADFSFEWGQASVGETPILFTTTAHPGHMLPDILEVWSAPFTIPTETASLTYTRGYQISVVPKDPHDLGGDITVTGLMVIYTWLMDAESGKRLAAIDGVYRDSERGVRLDASGNQTVMWTPPDHLLGRRVYLATMISLAPDALNLSSGAYRIEPVATNMTEDFQ